MIRILISVLFSIFALPIILHEDYWIGGIAAICSGIFAFTRRERVKLVTPIFAISSLAVFLGGERYGMPYLSNMGLAGLFFCLGTVTSMHEKLDQSKRMLSLLSVVILASLACKESTLPPSLRSFFPSSDRVAYCAPGVWASASSGGNKIDIQSQYSYSHLLKLLRAEELKEIPHEDIDEFGEIWLVTPTKPLTDEELRLIHRWVYRGGKLFVIGDHTDLFGHATALTPLMDIFNVSINTDAIWGMEGPDASFHSVRGKSIGLTACSFQGDGDPIYVALGYSEDADYSGRSFFGNVQKTDDDLAGLHFIGMRSTHGFGQVISFGDSTMFADFAISRHGSQKALRTLCSKNPTIPLYDLLLYLSIGVSLLLLKVERGYGLVFLCGAVFLYGCISILQRNSTELHWPKDAIEINGDPLLSDPQSSPYAGAFAGWYKSSQYFPLWKDAQEGSEYLKVGEAKLTANAPIRHLHIRPEEILLNECSESRLNALLNTHNIEELGGYGEVWFDDGIGMLRERAFKAFWGENIEHIDTDRLDEGMLKIRKINTKKFEEPIIVKFTKVSPEWYILGGGVVARRISDGNVLLARKSWQFSNFVMSDFAVEVSW